MQIVKEHFSIKFLWNPSSRRDPFFSNLLVSRSISEEICMSIAKKWVIFSYHANRNGVACSHHIDDRLPLLTKKGVKTTVMNAQYSGSIDGTKFVRIPDICVASFRSGLRSLLRKATIPKWLERIIENVVLLPIYPFYKLEKMIFRIDEAWFWTLPALIAAYLLCRSNRPDIIYSTGGPISAHIAARFLSRLMGLKWIAEFQDPLIHSYCASGKLEFKLTTWAERVTCRDAHRVIFLTEEARRICAARTCLGDHGMVIYPGASPIRFLPVSYISGKSFTFSYTGSLVFPRKIEPFLCALDQLINERPDIARKIKLDIYGDIDEVNFHSITEFPFKNIISVKGRTSREDAIAAMSRSDALLVIQGEDPVSSETIPSKSYEYFFASRPVLGIVYRCNELKDLLSELGHMHAEADDVPEIKAKVHQLMARWETGQLEAPSAISRYTTEKAVMELLSISAE